MARTKRRREATAILLASLVAHGLLLAWLITSIPKAPTPPTALPFQVSLIPDLPRVQTPEPAPVAAPAAKAKAARPAAAISPRAMQPLSAPSATPPAPAETPPLPPAGPASSAAPSVGAGPTPDADAQAAVRRALRTTLGCAHADFAGLSQTERDDCSRQLGRQAAIGAQENMERVPEEKRVYYAKVQKAYQDIRNYVGLSGLPMPGHGAGIACKVPFGIPKGWRAVRPPHSLKLGPCYLLPPQGILTPEADLPTP
ncbi:MAG: hypothetical protein ACYDD1_16020 [Caulobacteraceae bacterium]